MGSTAERALLEFGGLHVQQSGPGRECAISSFTIDPSLAKGEEERFYDYENIVEKSLFPLGEAFEGHAFLAIDDDGRVYLVADDVMVLGETIHEAIESLVVGRRPWAIPG